MSKLKIKLTLILGIITILTLSLLCFGQVAQADEVKAEDTHAGYVVDMDNVKTSFDTFNEMNNICNQHYSAYKLCIVFTKDFNFEHKTLFVPKHKELTLKLGSHVLYSHGSDPNPMFKVEGGLHIYGEDSEHRGTIHQSDDGATTCCYKGGNVYAENVNFAAPRQGAHSGDGGHFYFDDSYKESTFKNCSFTGEADCGVAVYVNDYDKKGCTFIFDTCTFDSCHAKNKGGAIYNEAEHVNFKFINTKFTNCHSDSEGGAIAAIEDDQHYTFTDTVIDSCSAGNDGGAIYAKGSDCSFEGSENSNRNSSYVPYSKLHLSAVIKNCSTTEQGGAIYTSNATGCGNDITIKNFVFDNNKSDEDGGAVCVYGKHNHIANCLFRNNRSGAEGGGLYVGCSRAVGLNNCEFDNNTLTSGNKYYDLMCDDDDDFSRNNTIFYQTSFDYNKSLGDHKGWVENSHYFTPVQIEQ